MTVSETEGMHLRLSSQSKERQDFFAFVSLISESLLEGMIAFHLSISLDSNAHISNDPERLQRNPLFSSPVFMSVRDSFIVWYLKLAFSSVRVKRKIQEGKNKGNQDLRRKMNEKRRKK
jgi:hypothetical protein